MTENRLPAGGRIDRSGTIEFRFDGRAYMGFKGDTLASALLANGVKLVGRSFKYHRPRGILSAGMEEPNALVTLGADGRREPNIPATVVELAPGLTAESQNRWPSLRFDLQSINGLFAPLLASGFYYKTFMGPGRKAWLVYEHFIRKAAGLGTGTIEVDPDRYETRQDFTDVAVVGAGAAGLSAARAAARAGARVVLIEQDFEPGGRMLAEPDASGWLADMFEELAAMPNLRLLTRNTAFGIYDGTTLGLVGHADPFSGHATRQTFTLLHARTIVFATGALERPMVFSNNDRPGVMLASAIRTYLHRFGVLPGRNIVIGTAADDVYSTAFDLVAQGARVTLVDSRAEIGTKLREVAKKLGIELHLGSRLHKAEGVHGVRAAVIKGRSGEMRLACDLIGMAGGWTPVVHLTSHLGSKPRYRSEIDAFVPCSLPAGQFAAGAMMGAATTAEAVRQGHEAGRLASAEVGHVSATGEVLVPALEETGRSGSTADIPFGLRKAFVDFQMDVSLDDIALAQREGYESVEHLKRYTTLGMGTDQGKTSNVNAIRAMAALRGTTVEATGTTTFRPPYAPVAIGALAGRAKGHHFRPFRRTPMHDWHIANGTEMLEVGLWMRPWYFKSFGRDINQAYVNEMRHVRSAAGLMDISTLGKIAIKGPDAATLLDRVYANGFASLKIGRARYGVMLRDDGIVMDDGTTTRVAENSYFMTTSTAKAADVMSWLEYLLDVAWPDLLVSVTSVTDEWAGMSVAGPKSRAVLEAAFPGLDMSNEVLPHMACVEHTFEESRLRIVRLSYSGERAYEIYVGASRGLALWELLLARGKSHDLRPYGVEALGALRVEKGHVAGPEIDGRTTLADLGMERMVAKRSGYVGAVLSRRAAFSAPDRQRVVGLECLETGKRLHGGALLFAPGEAHHGHGSGRITSTTFSPELDRSIGLGLLAANFGGDEVVAVYPMKNEVVRARLVSPVFLDPRGERMHG